MVARALDRPPAHPEGHIATNPHPDLELQGVQSRLALDQGRDHGQGRQLDGTGAGHTWDHQSGVTAENEGIGIAALIAGVGAGAESEEGWRK